MKTLIFIILLMCNIAYSDTTITALPNDAAPTYDDLLITVNSPGGTPQTRKSTIGNVFKSQGLFNVKNYGALGDGSTDDTTAIQAAIDAAEAGGYSGQGGTVFFPEGTYITTGVTINERNVSLLGSGSNATTIKAKTGATGYIITIDGAAGAGLLFNNSIRHIEINGNDQDVGGISMDHGGLAYFEGIEIQDTNLIGWYIEKWQDSTFTGCIVRDVNTAGEEGVYIVDSADDNSNNLIFYDLHVENINGVGIYIDSANDGSNNMIVFTDLKLESGTGSDDLGIWLNRSAGTGNNTQVYFIRPRIVNYDNDPTDNGIGIKVDAPGDIYVSDGWFWNSAAGGIGIDMNDGNAIVKDTIFYNWTTKVSDATGDVLWNEYDFSGYYVLNQHGNDIDFVVEGDTNSNLIHTDAANDRVGIGTGSPASTLHVNGTLTATTLDGIDIADMTDVGGTTQGSGRLLISDGVQFNSVVMSGDCTIESTGNMNCTGGSGAEELVELTDVNSSTQGAGRLLISDGAQFNSVALSGDVTLQSTGVATVSLSGAYDFSLIDVTTADDAVVQIIADKAITITSVSGSTDAGTIEIQLDERAPTTPNTAGTDIMASTLTLDTNQQSTTSFTNATIAAGNIINVDIDAVSTATIGRVHIEYDE